MIQYKCDFCGDVCSRDKINIIECFPRRIRTYATDALGVKLQAFEDCGLAETHLCDRCCQELAMLLPVAEDGQYD